MSSEVISVNQFAVFSISVNNSSLTSTAKDAVKEGLSNRAYAVSYSDLPTSVFQDVEGSSLSRENSTGLGLGAPKSSDRSAEDNENESQHLCVGHGTLTRPAKYFCVQCLVMVCENCHRVHHRQHKVTNIEPVRLGDNQELRDTYEECIRQREEFQKALTHQLGQLDTSLNSALQKVNSGYESVVVRVNESREKSVIKIKAAISAQRESITEKLNTNQNMIDSCRNVVDSELWSPDQDPVPTVTPMSLLVPKSTLDVSVPEVTIPQVELDCSTALVSVEPLRDDPQQHDISLIKAIGTKGEQELQFKLPGGVCIDTQNTVYVAEEGNNRIQKIGNDGRCLGTFTWGKTDTYITDVTYDPYSDSLVVPRAYSGHGLLKCCTFSYVTLDGREVSRFTVPSMKGGVLVSASRQGHLLISDVVKKSVFIIIDSHVHLEIQNDVFLKAPAHAVVGLNGDILVADSLRRVIVVFDKNGTYIRDIGNPDELKKPSGLSVDLSCGVIAVTDWCADQLVLYSYVGSRLGSADGFKCPHSVVINDNHKIVVTDSWNSQLKVFTYGRSD